MKLVKRLSSWFKIKNLFTSNSVSKKYYYHTNRGNKFFISENGWLLVNSKNHPHIPNIETETIEELVKFTSINPEYNYLIHSTITGETGGFVLITHTTDRDIVTDNNLDAYVKEYLDYFSIDPSKLKSFKREFINRPLNNTPNGSLHVKLEFKDGSIEEHLKIQGRGITISRNSEVKNQHRCEKIMFEVLDTIELF